MKQSKTKKIILLLTVLFFVHGGFNDQSYGMDEQILDLHDAINFKNDDAKINFSAEEANIKKTIRSICKTIDLNVIFDDSVEGTISLDLKDVTVKEALNYIRASAGLYYRVKEDNILIVSTQEGANEKGINRYLTKIIPVKYITSKLAEQIINTTIFNAKKDSEETNKKVINEYRTNSLILVGSDNDIRKAEEFIKAIDRPRESKSFRLNHSNPITVATILSSTVFNDGISPLNSESEGVKGSDLRVLSETFQEGSGSSDVSGDTEDAGSYTIRTKTLSEEVLKVSPEGPIIVPDTRTSTITIMGTREQIQLVENILPSIDKKLPQVSIETSLIEVSSEGIRELNAILGGTDGQFATSFNNSLTNNVSSTSPAIQPRGDITFTQTFTDPLTGIITTNDVSIANGLGLNNNVIGFPTIVDNTLNGRGGGAVFTTVPLERSSNIIVQVNSLLTNKKAKMIANPTIVAMHNTEAVISIVDEIIRSQTVTRDATGFQQTQTEIGEAGIVLNVVPKIGDDHFITMRLRPSVSSIRAIVPDPVSGSITTLLTRRDFALQEVRVKDGNTLALGGLISESDTVTVSKVPWLGDLPIVGILFRSTSKNSNKNEIIMLLTPNILKEKESFLNLGNIQDISQKQG